MANKFRITFDVTNESDDPIDVEGVKAWFGELIIGHDLGDITNVNVQAHPIIALPTKEIILLWSCPDCDTEVAQYLSEIPESGTAICPVCENDCHLDDQVLILAR